MAHTTPKGQRRNSHLTHGQELLHGPKSHCSESGLLPGKHGKVVFPTHPLDRDQSGGKGMTWTHRHGMPCPAYQKNKVIVHGMPQATDSPGHLPLHRGDHRTWQMHHDAKDKSLL